MRILLLMLLPIGDTLFATPAIHALRRRYPDAHITALIYPTNLGVVRHNPDIDAFLMWPTRQSWPGLLGVLRLFRRLRRARFNLAVEFSNYNWWVTRLGGIPQRTEMNLPKLWWLLPWAGREWREQHAVEHYAHPVRELGIPVEDMKLRIYPTSEEQARAQSWLQRYSVEDGELLVGLHLGGEGLWGRKRWGIEKFAALADGLATGLGARILVMGGRDDAPLAADLMALTHAPIINATAQTTLGETAALAARCDLFIGNDSSPLHIASAAGAKVVGVYGPTNPRSYHPWMPGGREGVHYAVVRSHLPCACQFSFVGGATLLTWARAVLCPALNAVTPEQVLDAATALLASNT